MMRNRTSYLISAELVFTLLMPTYVVAQAPAASTTGGASSSVPIESQMIAYEAVSELARELARRVSVRNECLTPELYNCIRGMSKKDAYDASHDPKLIKNGNACAIAASANTKTAQPPSACELKGKILLGTPVNMAALSTYNSFVAATDDLTNIYNSLVQPQGPAAPKIPPGANQVYVFPAPGLVGGEALAGSITGFITAAKGQTTQSGSTFAAVDQALFSDLEREFWAVNRKLVVTAFPGDYADANKVISQKLQQLVSAHDMAADRYRHLSAHTGSNFKADYDPLASEMKPLEASYSAIQGALGGASGPTILLGGGLISSLKTEYDVLTIADTAIGGGQRANTYFLVNLFVPFPHPSYNGGAVISYTLRGSDGEYKSADTIRLAYGYGKWHEHPYRDKNNDGPDNFQWDRAHNKGHWKLVY